MNKKHIFGLGIMMAALATSACNQENKTETPQELSVKDTLDLNINPNQDDLEMVVDRFADIQVLRYKINDFDNLSVDQKKLVYFLAQAGLSGRDIIYDQNNEHNLEIRAALDNILANYQGDRKHADWLNLELYAKRFYFANGVHHHYGMQKMMPGFDQAYFNELTQAVGTELSPEALELMFSDKVGMKRKNKNPEVDMIVASANNFYGEGVTQEMVEAFYAKKSEEQDSTPVELGLNSKLVLENGELVEKVYAANGMYAEAIQQIIYWLEQATTVAENEDQKAALEKLIEYYQTGDLETWDEYNILWAKSTAGDIDYINGFIEVYGDALGKRASFESIVQITDFDASERMKVVANNVQWFEDNSPIMNDHKKKNVKGVSYKVVQVASEAGDASPSTPIGVNLPNNNWIREQHGSKSVSLGNLIAAYNESKGSGLLEEFANDAKEIELAKAHAKLAGKMHTALHEVVGHASGQINKGVGQPAETLKNYASTLEEARADLVGLYYIMDPKLMELGLVESLEVGVAEYDGYIRNGLMTQLMRLELGDDIEEEHMQNRQLVAAWAMEKGAADKVIERVVKDGKTYFNINDYDKLRELFGELLKEIQRIKSEGDYEAGKNLVETYGVKVNQELHKEVLERVKVLDLPPYQGFVNPVLSPVKDAEGNIVNIKVEYNQNFLEQMLYYSEKYSFLK
ncbi:dipeptidyl-peptidase-3 [Lishizhenia tianjinensis]|uniref:Dipeptidyl-peptidase-3 n=1 Tax=Lishizhenia tianjinensis TaxID=477690 RepID=A0A1I6Z2Q2_9FLAO|nr:dipeptidyl peptidase 3 [Lishizhenia tianjinensis]SFT56681.1 dipeptidyl-peptidase-3 [Lishizhenia tianjinensis]